MKTPYLDTVIYDNFYELLKGRLESSAEKTAIRFRREEKAPQKVAGKEAAHTNAAGSEQIVDITYREMTRLIAEVYYHIREQGYRGKHIAILSENRYEYILLYLAAIFDNVIVPLDKELDAQTIADCFQRFDVEAVFATKRTEKKLPASFKKIDIDELFASFDPESDRTQDFLEAVRDTDKDRFAVLASTSGTDGVMKGVMLTQYNVITNIRGTLENNILKDPTLAFLPMNHTYGFNPCILATLYNGTTVCLCNEIKYLLRDIKTFDPFFFGAVPLVIEGMYGGIMREVKRRGKEKQFQRLLKISDALRKIGIDVRHLFFGKILSPRLRLVVSGGAMLNSEYVDLFDRMGITILNGYGLTECSPTIAVSRTCNNVAGSAGTIMKHIEVKTAEDGELLVKGPNVMLGYYKDEEATKACMRDGYFATGDIGYTTEERLIYITGRKKNLIVLENGKNISPEYLEDRLNKINGIKESIVTVRKNSGGHELLAAKIVTEEDGVKETIQDEIDALNQSLPAYMKIKDVEFRTEAFEKSSSGKIRRKLYDT